MEARKHEGETRKVKTDISRGPIMGMVILGAMLVSLATAGCGSKPSPTPPSPAPEQSPSTSSSNTTSESSETNTSESSDSTTSGSSRSSASVNAICAARYRKLQEKKAELGSIEDEERRIEEEEVHALVERRGAASELQEIGAKEIAAALDDQVKVDQRYVDALLKGNLDIAKVAEDSRHASERTEEVAKRLGASECVALAGT